MNRQVVPSVIKNLSWPLFSHLNRILELNGIKIRLFPSSSTLSNQITFWSFVELVENLEKWILLSRSLFEIINTFSDRYYYSYCCNNKRLKSSPPRLENRNSDPKWSFSWIGKMRFFYSKSKIKSDWFILRILFRNNLRYHGP